MHAQLCTAVLLQLEMLLCFTYLVSFCILWLELGLVIGLGLVVGLWLGFGIGLMIGYLTLASSATVCLMWLLCTRRPCC